MSDYRINQKSIRVSDDVLKYIEGFDGDNFNDKLNNVIYYCMKVIDDKKKEVSRLDDMIKQKEKEFSDLFRAFITLDKLKRTESHFASVLSIYNDDLEKFNNSFSKVVCKDDK